MKGLFENADCFQAHATIGAAYYMLEELQARMKADSPKDGLSRMIDQATGFGAAKNKEYYIEAIVIFEDMIAAKKVVDADCTNDEKLLIALKEGLNNLA